MPACAWLAIVSRPMWSVSGISFARTNGGSFEAVTKALQFLFVICRGVHTDKDGYIAFLRNEMPHQLAGECSIYKRIDGDGGKALRPRRVRSNTHNRNSTPSGLVDARPKPTWVSRRDH